MLVCFHPNCSSLHAVLQWEHAVCRDTSQRYVAGEVVLCYSSQHAATGQQGDQDACPRPLRRRSRQKIRCHHRCRLAASSLPRALAPWPASPARRVPMSATHCNTQQHPATPCSSCVAGTFVIVTLQHTAAHCNTLHFLCVICVRSTMNAYVCLCRGLYVCVARMV